MPRQTDLISRVALIATAAMALALGCSEQSPDAEPDTKAVTTTQPDISDMPRVDVALADAPVGLDIGNRAPDFNVGAIDGRQVQLADYRGQVVVLDFWELWCGPCKRGMPQMQQLHEELASRGVNIVGFVTEKPDASQDYMSSKGFTYQILLGGKQTDWKNYQVTSIPKIIVIGVDGTILGSHVGFTDHMGEEIKAMIEPHLQEHGL